MVISINVKLESRRSGKEILVKAIVNSAYESTKPEILLPLDIANTLELQLNESIEVTKILADGSRVSFRKIESAINVYVVTEDRIVGPVVTDVVISSRGRRVLVSDALASALGIVLIDLKEGLWCFKDELGVKVRRSVK